MTWRSLPARDRRVLLVGATVIAAILGSTRLVPQWVRTRAAITDAAVTARTRVEFAESLLRLRTTSRDSGLERSRRYLALAPRILPGRSPSAAGAALAGMVSGAAEGSGLRLVTVQIQPDTTRLGVFTKVGVRVDVTGDIHGIAGFVLSVDRGPLMLKVREFSISQTDAAGDDSRSESLRGEFIVEALMLSPIRR